MDQRVANISFASSNKNLAFHSILLKGPQPALSLQMGSQQQQTRNLSDAPE